MREVDLFLEYVHGQDLAANTVDHYILTLKDFFNWFAASVGRAELAAVTPLDLRQYRDHLKADKKGSTVNRRLSGLTVFFRWCVEQGYIASNPAEKIKRSRTITAAPKWLSRPETYTILRLLDQQVQIAKAKNLDYSELIAVRNLAMVRLMLNAGLRVGEICDLKLTDVKIAERSGSVLVRYGKGGKQREIPLNLDARKALQTWLNIRLAEGEYLFNGPEGDKLGRLVVNWHIGQLGKKAGLPDLHPHRLRHTFGKNLVDSGVPLDRVAMLMGHSNLSTTARYTMPGESDLQRAVDKISWDEQ